MGNIVLVSGVLNVFAPKTTTFWVQKITQVAFLDFQGAKMVFEARNKIT